ncbi:uncharacterized protein LOC124155226 [Ischnura elegans]|uniref:uncharacterized protein LOC124155226 n=1 Tax=Ischnura elegans TaxID=197161 RepID=UPI001ED86BAB|nr:uncharacterized protein LOC124155226 [Ischnura elegans]
MGSSVPDRYFVTSPRLPEDQAKNGKHRQSRLLTCFLVLIVVACLVFLLTRPGSCPARPQDWPWHQVAVVMEPEDVPQQQVTTRKPTVNHVADSEDGPMKRASGRGFLIQTSGCKIPDLDPLDPAVRKFVRFYELESNKQSEGEEDDQSIRPDCSGKFGPALVESNLTSLYVVPSALSHYNATKISDVYCCFRPFHRVTMHPSNYTSKCDDVSKYDEECIPFEKDGTIDVLDEEFVRVECRKESVYDDSVPMFYKDFHYFAPVVVALERAEEQRKEYNLKDVKQSSEREKWNVLILGMDAVSRLNFHRQMPKTKEVLENLGANEILGYTKIGDNTFPNIVGVMTGMPEEELKATCWPESSVKLDDCPWIWYNYTAAGYLTAFGEDATWMATFDYAKTGFLKPPMHFYLRPLAKKAEDENGHLKRWNAKVCVGPRLSVATVFGYAEKVVQTLVLDQDKPPFFGHFWATSLSHDYLNSLGYMDDPFSELIGRIEETGVLEKTVLLVISDHGLRWGGIRSTYQGRLEERLPLAYIRLPQAMRDKYPSASANLRRNAKKRLTTPYDIHATLLDILHADTAMTQEAVSRRSKELPSSPPKGNATSELPRSVSLFLPIPEWRTCKIAWIDPHWCCCHSAEKDMDQEDPVVKEAASILIERVNELVDVYPQCAKRNLTLIKSAIMSSPPDELLPEEGKQVLQDLALIVESDPGSALFEATVRLIPTKEEDEGNTTYDMKVIGTISRINRYGNQSACVDEFHAKLYCYCGS